MILKLKKLTQYDCQRYIQYEIKEDWFFDKQRSVLDVRIIGIAPVVYALTLDARNSRS